jgi:hypothetical protein
MPNDLPSTRYVPARFDWLQHLAERFSLFIDALSRQLSTVLRTVGWPGVRVSGHRFYTRLRGNSHPGQRDKRVGDLRPALRDPGAAAFFSPGAIPRGFSATSNLLVAVVRRPVAPEPQTAKPAAGLFGPRTRPEAR